MARFSAVLLVVSLLLAGRLAHAAPPSTAEVFWRSAMPDAVLRLLRPDNHLVSKAKAEDDAGRPIFFDDSRYTRSSAAPTGDHSDVAARDPLDLDKNKGSTKRFTAENTGQGGSWPRMPCVGPLPPLPPLPPLGPFEYNYIGARNGPVAAAAAAAGEAASYGNDHKAPSSGARDEVPVIYNNKAHMEHHHAGGGGHVAATSLGTRAATATMFFPEEAARVGERLLFYFPADAAPAPLGLLPRRIADSIPFTATELPQVLALLGVSPSSAKAAGMAETLRTCELPGEAKFCATSMEALVEHAVEALGTNDVRAWTSTLPRAGAPLQLYTIRAVRPIHGASFLTCHDQVYPYTVYRCHATGPARAYMVEMEAARGGGAVTLATICHTDTSRWNPEHVSFKLFGTKPGGAPVCHLMPNGHIIWAKNVNTSPAKGVPATI